MRFARSFLILATATVLLAVSANAAIPSAALVRNVPLSLKESIQGNYIVKLRPGNQLHAFISEHNSFAQGASAEHTYDLGRFQGFSGKLNEDQLARYKQDPRVEYVQAQNIMTIAGQQASPPSWGLPRVSQRNLDNSAPYVYPDTAGEGAEIWVIDTGVVATHSDFEGRATMAKSFVKNEANTDMHGHGTHVAGTTASKSYGVAKKAKVFGVKVLNGQGSGSDADVIAGVQYVAQNARRGKSVVNMSLGGPKSQALDDAVNAAVDAGVVFIVAAGNDSKDACIGSPSGASKVFAVAASDKNDQQAYFSNIGKCVKTYAPGMDIKSLWKGTDGSTNTISGTSMASPHVAGVAALYLAAGNYSSVNDVYSALIANATPNVIKGASPNTVNRMVYNQPGANTPSPNPGPSPSPSPVPEPSPAPAPSPDDPFPWPFPWPKPTPSPDDPFPWPFPWPKPGDGSKQELKA
ncbi:peptidase S8/S53 domain-containing protein [Syncephalis fuscata]|nr:peptidase S8/S53 domain-containing protein [Syncephalis fuscata]